MTDDKNNALVFVNGHLLHMEDANGNLIRLYYVYSDGTSASNGYPSSSGSRITRIVQKNQGCSEITVATLNYDSAKYLTSVKDGAGRTYTLGYKDKKLVSISRDGTLLAQ